MKTWDDGFITTKQAELRGDQDRSGKTFSIASYVPFYKLNTEDKDRAKALYKESDPDLTFISPEHYYYPVNGLGRLVIRKRVLAIPIDAFDNPAYMQSLGYKIK